MFVDPDFDSPGGHAHISKIARTCNQVYTMVGVAVSVFNLSPNVVRSNDDFAGGFREMAHVAIAACMVSCNWGKKSLPGHNTSLRLWTGVDQDILQVGSSFEGEHRALNVQCAGRQDVPPFEDYFLNLIRLGSKCSDTGHCFSSLSCGWFKKNVPMCVQSSFAGITYSTYRITFQI